MLKKKERKSSKSNHNVRNEENRVTTTPSKRKAVLERHRVKASTLAVLNLDLRCNDKKRKAMKPCALNESKNEQQGPNDKKISFFWS